MVQEGDSQGMSGIPQPVRDFPILRRGIQTSRRMVVRGDDGAGPVGDGFRVDLPGMHDRRIILEVIL